MLITSSTVSTKMFGIKYNKKYYLNYFRDIGKILTKKAKQKKKWIKGPRTKPPTPTWGIDALPGEEEQNGKQEKKKKQEARPQTSYPGPFGRLLQPARTIW